VAINADREQAVGNLLDLASREGLLGADFSPPFSYTYTSSSTSPEGVDVSGAENAITCSDNDSEWRRCEGLPSVSGNITTSTEEFEHAVLAFGNEEGARATDLTHALYPPLALLGRLYREVR
jgi:hypothetical protein